NVKGGRKVRRRQPWFSPGARRWSGRGRGTDSKALGGSLTAEIPVQEIKRALPGQLSGSLVITWRCVVVETVIGSLVSVRRVIHPIRLQRRFVSRPPFGNPCVESCVMQQERGLDLRGILSTRLPTVERNCSPQVWKPNCEIVNNCSAET